MIVLLASVPLGAGCDANAMVSDQSTAALVPVPAVVRPFQQAAASGDARRIAGHVRYPLSRPHPLPPVRDPDDFVRRFDELLPPALIADIAEQNEGDWQEVGWRGWMFQRGRLWVDHHGLLIGNNDKSEAEKKHRQRLIARDRASLHAELRDYEQALLCWQTKTYRVRIDRLPGGSLRYASWRRSAGLDAVPDLVLLDGEHRVEGTARNEYYEWQSGDHTYHCNDLTICADETPPRELLVQRKGKLLLREAAKPFYPVWPE